ncbi:MAG: hypothetical protein OES19_00990 [Nitrosopumilus sp.]|nr:hypothetical protein [Nitrosopumilus sp.]
MQSTASLTPLAVTPIPEQVLQFTVSKNFDRIIINPAIPEINIQGARLIISSNSIFSL